MIPFLFQRPSRTRKPTRGPYVTPTKKISIEVTFLRGRTQNQDEMLRGSRGRCNACFTSRWLLNLIHSIFPSAFDSFGIRYPRDDLSTELLQNPCFQQINSGRREIRSLRSNLQDLQSVGDDSLHASLGAMREMLGRSCFLLLAFIHCVGGEGGVSATIPQVKSTATLAPAQNTIPKISLSERSDLRGKSRKIAVVTYASISPVYPCHLFCFPSPAFEPMGAKWIEEIQTFVGGTAIAIPGCMLRMCAATMKQTYFLVFATYITSRESKSPTG
jgi:hypothetical protein